MKAIIYSVLLCSLIGCSTATSVKPVQPRADTAVLNAQPLDFYTQQLAERLFSQLPALNTLTRPAAEIAVASFVPLNSLSLAQADEAEKQMANQLAESMLTHALQRGFIVYDYRLRQQLLLQEDHEQVLSRQLAEVGSISNANVLLAGTYTPMEDGIMVNARLISTKTKQVLAAASGYVPANVMWSQQNVSKRGDKLYRH